MADFGLVSYHQPTSKLDMNTNQPVKKLGINFGIYYLGKSLNKLKDTSSGENKDNGFFIDLDLGFISAGENVRSYLPGEDSLIPRLKLGLVKGFKF